MKEVVNRRKLKSGIELEKIEETTEGKRNNNIRVFELDPGNAKIMFSWSFTAQRQVPWDLPEKENGSRESEEYNTKRISEVMAAGGGIDPATIETQRKGIMDTGIHLLEAEHCEGGLILLNQLLENDWKITDAWFSKRESEQSKAEKKGPYKVPCADVSVSRRTRNETERNHPQRV